LYQFLYGYPPFNASTPYEIFENILNMNISWEKDDPPSPEALDLMKSLMNPDPEVLLSSFYFIQIK